jgi:N-acetyltransferase
MFLRMLTPLLETSHMHDTVQFYTEILGFRLADSREYDSRLRWCALQRDNVWLMFRARNLGMQEPQVDGDLYFHVPDIKSSWEQLKHKAEVVYEPKQMPYGAKEFAIKDNNGYVLRFSQTGEPGAFDKKFSPGLELETGRVKLRILQAEDVGELQKLTASDTTWNYFTKDLTSVDALKAWVAEAMQDYGAERRVPFAIIDKMQNRIAGSTSYGSISFFDKRIEIGWSWLGDEFKGTGVNTHAKYLLLRYAFEVLQMERVEIKTDNLNERSKAALHKIGATPEGVLRSHMQMPKDRRRDSIYFSVLKSEWEKLKAQKFAKIGS